MSAKGSFLQQTAHRRASARPVSAIDRVVAIDYSGDRSPAGQRRKIWAGVWTANSLARRPGRVFDGAVTLESGRTRAELTDWLIELACETPRMVVGVDCCFSFPAWFLAEHGCPTVLAFWQAVAQGKGEAWLHRDCADGRFWGVTGPARTGKRPAEFSGQGLRRMMRSTDWENKIAVRLEGGEAADPARAALMHGITAKSPFQIGGSGSVGTGTLRAMPMLLALHHAGFRIWPFDHAALADPADPRPLLVEMYTRLLTGPVAKSNPQARRAYLLTRSRTDPAYAGLSRPVLARACAGEDAFDALVCCLEFTRRQDEFPALRATSDPGLALEGVTWRPGVHT
ncbi:MAG: hypothetical protein M3O02_08650 [Acidobacteriota bacterium]|nr:hypothetical protein [Acidobacteriota bacterium]